MDSNINNCENSTENIPSNLSVLLEKIQKEQNSLSARVQELEREKTGLEEVITRNRKISDRHEEKLTSLAKRIFIVTQDIKSRKTKYDSLAGGDDTDDRLPEMSLATSPCRRSSTCAACAPTTSTSTPARPTNSRWRCPTAAAPLRVMRFPPFPHLSRAARLTAPWSRPNAAPTGTARPA